MVFRSIAQRPQTKTFLARHILRNLVLRLIVVFWMHIGRDKTLVLHDNLALLGIQSEGVVFAECVACVQMRHVASWQYN